MEENNKTTTVETNNAKFGNIGSEIEISVIPAVDDLRKEVELKTSVIDANIDELKKQLYEKLFNINVMISGVSSDIHATKNEMRSNYESNNNGISILEYGAHNMESKLQDHSSDLDNLHKSLKTLTTVFFMYAGISLLVIIAMMYLLLK